MAGRDEARIVKPVFLRNSEPIPVWELVKLGSSQSDISKERNESEKSRSRSDAAKKAWKTIKRKRRIGVGHELA